MKVNNPPSLQIEAQTDGRTQSERETDRQWDVGSVQMCIPAASGVMEPFNRAQQECKHTERRSPGASQEQEREGRWWRTAKETLLGVNCPPFEIFPLFKRKVGQSSKAESQG